jgi:flagellar biogenesis protein FliO
MMKDKSIVVEFPTEKLTATANQTITRNIPVESQAKAVTVKAALSKKEKELNPQIEKYNEEYLNKLLKETDESKKTKLDSEDKISVKASSPQIVASVMPKNKQESTSLNKYILKFVGFLCIVIALFYTLVQLFRKKVIKDGRLSFLKSSPSISILSTTYVGPKRSLITVKIHEQIFLLGNSEAGIQLITEVKENTAFVKETEKEISGINFDGLLDEVKDVSHVKIKDVKDKTSNSNVPEVTAALKKPPISSFTKELKKKLKNLKQLQ